MSKTNSLPDLEEGRRESDVRPKVRVSLPSKTKGLCMDDAISKTKFGFFNYVLIFVGGLILFAVIMETCGMVYVLPIAGCDLNLSTAEKGVLAAVAYIGIICSSHLWGYLADTKGRRAVIHPTLLVAFLLSFAASFVQNFHIFVLLRFLNGFFISGGSATIYAYLGEFHNINHRGRAIMGSSEPSEVVGHLCILLPLIAGGVINLEFEFTVPFIGITYTPWRLFLVVCSLPGLLAFAIISFLPESPKFVLGQGNQSETFEILQKMNRINNGRNAQLEHFEIYEEPESIENRQQILKSKTSRFPLLTCIWNQTAPLFRSQYLYSTFLICCVQFFAFATGNGFYMFFTEILNRMATNLDNFTTQKAMMCDVINMKLTPNYNGTADELDEVCVTKLNIETLEQGLSMEVLYAGFLLLIGIIVNKVGLFSILFVSLIVPGICGFVCMFTNIPLLQICAFIGLMLACIAPNVVNAATVEIYPTASRAMAVCISLMFGRLGSVVGANIAAILLDNHCETVFYLSGFTLIGVSFLSFLISKVHKELAVHEDVPVGPRVSVMSLRYK